MSEKTYTLDEARAEIARRACAAEGHAPYHSLGIATSKIAIRWVCECGEMTWVPAS